MAKLSVVIPENILSKMVPADRKKYGKAGRTQMEIAQQQYIQSERKIHSEFVAFLRRHELPYVHSDPTKKSSIQPGHPDFQVTRDLRSIYIEFKMADGRLSQVQQDYIEFLRRNGNLVHVIVETAPGSALKAASEIITEFFDL